jgi:excisionase family DNA binding protein
MEDSLLLSVMQPTDLLTPGQVAEQFGVGLTTVARWADSGHIPSIRTPGGHRRFRRSDVDALLAKAAS